MYSPTKKELESQMVRISKNPKTHIVYGTRKIKDYKVNKVQLK